MYVHINCGEMLSLKNDSEIHNLRHKTKNCQRDYSIYMSANICNIKIYCLEGE